MLIKRFLRNKLAVLGLAIVFLVVLTSLTAKGRKAFEAIASEHERWVVELFGGIREAERQQLFTLLGQLRLQMSSQHDNLETKTP